MHSIIESVNTDDSSRSNGVRANNLDNESIQKYYAGGMNHHESPQEISHMVEQNEVEKVRVTLIDVLREAIKTYTRDGTQSWVNEQNALDIIARLQDKRPGIIQGPFWSEIFSEALERSGFVERSSEWREVWKRIEAGE